MTTSNITKSSTREDDLVRRIHRAVGGPAKLSTYDDPAAVREVVIQALANEQRPSKPDAALRIAKGDLTAFERRVVRTVTNRGAAVRSRMRQRKELARLREELRRKDVRLAQLESALQSITARFQLPVSPITPPHTYASPTLALPPSSSASSSISTDVYEDEAMQTLPPQHPKVEATLAPPHIPTELPAELNMDSPPLLTESVDRDLFGSLVDQLISPLT